MTAIGANQSTRDVADRHYAWQKIPIMMQPEYCFRNNPGQDYQVSDCGHAVLHPSYQFLSITLCPLRTVPSIWPLSTRSVGRTKRPANACRKGTTFFCHRKPVSKMTLMSTVPRATCATRWTGLSTRTRPRQDESKPRTDHKRRRPHRIIAYALVIATLVLCLAATSRVRARGIHRHTAVFSLVKRTEGPDDVSFAS